MSESPRHRRPKAARLRRSVEYAAVYAKGRRAHGTFLVQTVCRNEFPQARVGVTVGKKIGNAVTRNRVRRRLVALARTRYACVPPGVDLVVTARASAAAADFGALRDDFDRCLRRMKRLLAS